MSDPNSPAYSLLSEVAASPGFDHDTLAGELVVPRAALRAYLARRRPIPLDRQLALALFVIEKLPPLARSGHHLRIQVLAMLAREGRAAAAPGLWPHG